MKSEERHFAEVCAQQFQTVAHKWKIEGKITTIGTESARNMTAAAKLLPYEHMPCIAHMLQRSINVSLSDSGFVNVLAKCHKIVGHFKHSTANTMELQAQQAALGQQQEPLIQDVPTWWNSTLKMIKCLNRNKAAIRATLDQQHRKLVMLTPPEWDKLQRLSTLLEPCRYVTEILGGEAYISCSVVLPALSHLRQVMKVSEEDPAYVPSQDGPPRKKTHLLQMGSDSESDEEVQPDRDIHRYRAEPSISMEDCPMQWWAAHSGAHDKLALLARKYLGTPASTVPCERLFSVAGHIVQKKRSALNSDHVSWRLSVLPDWISGRRQCWFSIFIVVQIRIHRPPADSRGTAALNELCFDLTVCIGKFTVFGEHAELSVVSIQIFTSLLHSFSELINKVLRVFLGGEISI
ncbi:Zinc finger BED domain-containing protein 1 [Merluccius polli]|uniref:Zinc finger BED domain-containing protein 1 n=1 Tax=Merluccius polli TaxID=89951 RepID=A0AA47MHA6_MERPO|nr:Zinc finger BED domain-containing protein 1 [Merluccius polli]